MTHLEKLQCLGLQIVAYSLLFSLQPVDHPNFVSALIMQYTDHISSFVRASLVLLWKHCLREKKKKKKVNLFYMLSWELSLRHALQNSNVQTVHLKNLLFLVYSQGFPSCCWGIGHGASGWKMSPQAAPLGRSPWAPTSPLRTGAPSFRARDARQHP